MNKIFTIAIQWLVNKLTVFIIIIAVLLSGIWAKKQWDYIVEQKKEIAKKESLKSDLKNQAKALDAQKLALEQKLGQLNEEHFEKDNLLSIAKKAEAVAQKNYYKRIKEERWYYTGATHKPYYITLETEKDIYVGAKKATSLAHTNLDTAKDILVISPLGKKLLSISDSLKQQEKHITGLDESISTAKANIADKPIEKLKNATKSVAFPAFLILLGSILTPIAIKAFIYFLIAPSVSKTKAVQLLPECGGTLELKNCDVSVPILLEHGDELIVHSDYLQASGTGPGKNTKVLFSWKMPFTSIAAGLFMMVSVKNKKEATAKVTVSPKKDLFDKIAHLRIPTGSAAVIYPRSLIGVLVKNNDSVKITRHWNLFNLHSWITFQFRYLVIHGESSVLMRGCRGVRTETVHQKNAKMQDQNATVGFSANLKYSCERCETFLDYLLGRDALFNDKFSGENGVYLTEEIPHRGNKTGFFGRGLEGLLDGVLKGFGI